MKTEASQSAKEVTIYTDGACSGNPGPGGWAAALVYGDHARELVGGEAHTTNNRMELLAAIKALASLREKCKVTIYTDSQYLKNGIESWIHNWKKNGWRTTAKKPVLNEELWRELDREAQKHEITWRWVRGHDGSPLNERVDFLATQERDKYAEQRVT